MSSGPAAPGPRHLQGGARRARPVGPPAPAGPASPEAEVAPVLRVKRSRLAFALSVTVAALPVLVLDNLPASAERNEPLAVSADALADDARASTTTTAPPASTTEPLAPSEAATAATLTAPTTTAAPAPPATTAPAPARTVAAVQAPTPPPTPTTAPPAPARTDAVGDPNDPASWDAMAQCEAGGNWAINTGNGYYGGLQFSLATWQSYGGSGYPHEASKATQIAIGKKLQADRGWDAWPGCARHLGFT